MSLSLDFFTETKIVIPITQIVLFLSISTLALLFGRVKLALLTNYLFALYWGYLCNLGLYTDLFEKSEYIIYLYFGFGVAIALMAVVGFITHSNK
jgi:polyferredoxin